MADYGTFKYSEIACFANNDLQSRVESTPQCPHPFHFRYFYKCILKVTMQKSHTTLEAKCVGEIHCYKHPNIDIQEIHEKEKCPQKYA